MMKTGLDLLKNRSLKENINIENIEKSYEIVIPPILKVFVQYFEFKKELINNKSFYYYPDLSGGEVTFPFQEIESNIKASIGSSDEEIINKKLIILASNRFGFYVGTIEEAKEVLIKNWLIKLMIN